MSGIDWGQFTPVQDNGEVDWSHFKPVEQPGFLDRIGAAFKGNASEKIPDIASTDFENENNVGFLKNLKLAAGQAFSLDQNSDINAVLKNVPGSKLSQDSNGNPVIELDNGHRYYVNQPGFSAMDVFKTAGNIAKFAPASRFLGGLGEGANVLGRAALQGAGAAGTEALSEKAIDNSVNPKAVATAGAGAAGAELLSPVLSSAGRKIKDFFTSDAQAMNAGTKVAAQAGLTPDQISGLSDDVLATLGRSADQVKAGADPKALLAQAQYGLQLTKGQRLPEGANFDQLALEERLRNSPGNAGAILRDAQAQNVSKLQGAYQNTIADAAGGQVPQSVPMAMDDVQNAVQSQAGALSQAVKKAYGGLDLNSAVIPRQGAGALTETDKQLINYFGKENLSPQVIASMEQISPGIGQRLAGSAQSPLEEAAAQDRKSVV